MELLYIDIHTHHPTGHQMALRVAGIHPWQAAEYTAATLLPLPADTQAVGEIGLDYACKVDHAQQLELLKAQLALALTHNLPVILHCVRAFEPIMRELSKYPLRAVIFHGFIGSEQQALRAVACGYFLSFGERTSASPKSIKALCATPLDHIFCETDQSQTPIAQIYAQLATLRGTPLEQLRQAVEKNYKHIFG